MKNTVKAAVAFLVVCGMGFVTAEAGGAKWGTLEAGFITCTTFAIACLIAFFIYCEEP
jgi:hypothetical protein